MNPPSGRSDPPPNDEGETQGPRIPIVLLGLLLQIDKRAVVILLWLLLIAAVLYGLLVGA
ncbi:hypothetical protein [Haloarchaeobius sp. FL176]|uniref:hypothetical protein n=1 Tax=Haloarchaeobius sp. FL176 TaxID=2967129 RepID=UPI00214770C9|nr:hypothetical protein [Haloarchaeobius sp. FL176]